MLRSFKVLGFKKGLKLRGSKFLTSLETTEVFGKGLIVENLVENVYFLLRFRLCTEYSALRSS